jgi:general secretion pathway protein M
MNTGVAPATGAVKSATEAEGPASAAAHPLSRHLAPAADAWRQWWRGLALRERRALQIAAVLVALAVVWAVALAPAARTLRDAPAERDRLDAQLQQMQAQAAEAIRLRAVPPLTADAARNALQAAAGRLQDRAKLSLQGPRANLTLKGVTSAELSALLTEARVGARARVTDATLTQSSPGRFDGSLSLTLGGGAP